MRSNHGGPFPAACVSCSQNVLDHQLGCRFFRTSFAQDMRKAAKGAGRCREMAGATPVWHPSFIETFGGSFSAVLTGFLQVSAYSAISFKFFKIRTLLQRSKLNLSSMKIVALSYEKAVNFVFRILQIVADVLLHSLVCRRYLQKTNI